MDPSRPDGKHVYIVVMWATWCPACKISVPFLNKLHRQFKAKGVVIMGITAEEESLVAPFLKAYRVEYILGIDAGTSTTDAYEARTTGIPMVYVVDKTGKIAWKGSPLDGLDRVLSKVLAGTLDPRILKKKQDLETKLKAAAELADISAVLTTVDELIATEPDNPKYYNLKLGVLSQIGTKGPAQIQEVFRQWAKGCHDYAPGLIQMAMTLGQQNYTVRDPELMLSTARRAAELTQGTDPEILSGLATICAELSRLDEALEHIQAALRVARDEDIRKALQAQLAYLTKIKRLKTN